ncbi:hypothetical protein EC912_10653 [Luteibacter rhizovicinus]|uniref:YD repeat-containing protein n=1 Tax=Luteibacter rhizovicinus TaxID=242606 RepID=A0A4R3YJ50_9GAMM|nr:hypothetical protein EC912_10653 [Luteibacter rhizovicinus]
MKKGFGRFVPLLLAFGFAQAHAQSEIVTYVYTDSQGTPLAETDANGNITATFDYRPHFRDGGSYVEFGFNYFRPRNSA